MKYLKIFIFFLVVAIVSYGAISIPKIIKIKNIVCRSQFGNCNYEISTRLQGVAGENLYFSKKKIDQILTNIKLVEKYSIQFRLPDTVAVDILERKPRFALSGDDFKWVALIDKDGVVLSLTDSTNLPTVKILSSLPNPGEVVDEKTLFACRIVFGVSLQHSILEVEIDKSGLRVDLASGLKVVFPLEGDSELLLGSLNIIVGRLNNSEEEFKIEKVSDLATIDLRFKNPVLK